jgi:hypothetical protein
MNEFERVMSRVFDERDPRKLAAVMYPVNGSKPRVKVMTDQQTERALAFRLDNPIDLNSPLAMDVSRIAAAYAARTGTDYSSLFSFLCGYCALDEVVSPRSGPVEFEKDHFSPELFRQVSEWLEAFDKYPGLHRSAMQQRNAEILRVIIDAGLDDFQALGASLTDPSHGGHQSSVALARLIKKVLS